MTSSPHAESAQTALSPELWAYLAGGSETETALQRNRQALAKLALLPRVLADVSQVDQSVHFLGVRLASPLLLAPVGSLHLLHADSIAGVQGAAEQVGIGYGIGAALADARSVRAGRAAFYQIYAEGDVSWLREEVAAARERGFAAVIITVDAPVFPIRRRDVETGNHAASRHHDGTSVFRRSLTWDGLAQVISSSGGFPVIVKGVQDPRDVLLAADAGAGAVYLSNHGGRQFDQGPGAVDLIRPAAETLGGRVPLIVDGGFESGNDVLKALALGADLVALGRAFLHPFAAAGASGLAAFLGDLQDEISTNLALLGAARIADVRDLRVFTANS